MDANLETDVLKAVSRSFYLSLRFLPAPMRRPAAIAYLLARTSDTLADSTSVPAAERIGFLETFSRQVRGEGGAEPFPDELVDAVPDQGEAVLLRNQCETLAALDSLPPAEKDLVREVLETIIGGQELDLERFGEADGNHVVCLPDAAALDDYTWRVAGCVGSFWTRLGFLTLGKRFSTAPENELLEQGIEYGKGLQLVNILRDLPADLKAGRCYLPVPDPGDRAALMEKFSKWHATALEKVANGPRYSRHLEKRRLRVASALPAMIAAETLRMLDGAPFSRLEERIKVPRSKVYGMLCRAWFSL